eukprot:m.186345 g.186345  ORF g.186345 m.186345 type:complete len:409 (-) comp18134_c1_seq4:459-1685(-)
MPQHSVVLRVPKGTGQQPSMKVSGPGGWKVKSWMRADVSLDTPMEEGYVVSFEPRLPGQHTLVPLLPGHQLPAITVEVPPSSMGGVSTQVATPVATRAATAPLHRSVSHGARGSFDSDDPGIAAAFTQNVGFAIPEEPRRRSHRQSRHGEKLRKRQSMPARLLVSQEDIQSRCCICLTLLREGGRSYRLLGRPYCKGDFKHYFFKREGVEQDELVIKGEVPNLMLAGLRTRDIAIAQTLMRQCVSWEATRFAVRKRDALQLLRILLRKKYGSVPDATEELTNLVFQRAQCREKKAVFEDELLAMFAAVASATNATRGTLLRGLGKRSKASKETKPAKQPEPPVMPAFRPMDTSRQGGAKSLPRHRHSAHGFEDDDGRDGGDDGTAGADDELAARAFSGDKKSDAWMLY